MCESVLGSPWAVVWQRPDESIQSAAEQLTVQTVRRDTRWVLDDVLHIQLKDTQEVH